jgi:hypothetical protein
MIVPIAIYLAVNAGRPSAHGWGTAMSTDPLKPGDQDPANRQADKRPGQEGGNRDQDRHPGQS